MLIIGHRGAMDYEPENTLRSFQKAIDLKVDMVEFDVHLCKTGELVVIHDEKVNRTTDGQGFVAKKSLTELKELNVSPLRRSFSETRKGEKIPTLEEVLDLIDRKVKINIELKGPNTAEPTIELIKKYIKKKKWTYDDFLISSFNHHELEKIYSLNQKIKIGILVNNLKEKHIILAQKLKAISINPDIKKINNEDIERVHQAGFKIFVWSFNNIKKTNNLNFDGVFLNSPDKLNIC